MKRTLYIAALVAALALASFPAIADHVSEPTLPIKQIVALNIYDYPNQVTKINNCDGSESRTWGSARIEPLLSFETPFPGANANPSEHFSVRITVSTVTQTARREIVRTDWDALWAHQNRGPHSVNAQDMEVTQSNTYNLQSHLGLWQVDVQIVGDVSLRVLNATCRFRIVAP